MYFPEIKIATCAASTWEIRRLKTSNLSTEKCLVTHMLEVQYYSWGRWWRNQFSNFDKTIPYALLCQVTGWLNYFLCENWHIAIILYFMGSSKDVLFLLAQLIDMKKIPHPLSSSF